MAKIDLQNAYRIPPIHSDNKDCWELDGIVNYMSKQLFHSACVQPKNLQCFCRLLDVGDATRRYPVIYVVDYNPLHG